MSSFQISLTPSKKAAARYVTAVRRALQKALTEENKKSGLTQTEIARAIGVHRSVINRELRGQKNITLSRVAELAWALNRNPNFVLEELVTNPQANVDLRPFTNSANKDALIIGDEKKAATSSARVLEEVA